MVYNLICENEMSATTKLNLRKKTVFRLRRAGVFPFRHLVCSKGRSGGSKRKVLHIKQRTPGRNGRKATETVALH